MRKCTFCNTRYKKGGGLTFHKFPVGPTRQLWVNNMKKENWIPKPNDHLCCKHFTENCFVKHAKHTSLKHGSVPTIFVGTPSVHDDLACLPETAGVKDVYNDDDSNMSESTEVNSEDSQDQINDNNEKECRTCLTIFKNNEGLHHLNEPWFSPFETTTTIAEDLFTLTHIQIPKNDKNTKLICSRCISRLHNACAFILSVQNNEKSLLLRSGSSPVNGSVWPKPIQLDQNINGCLTDEIEIKQEIESEEETENVTGGDGYEMEIKVEPEEFIDNQPDIVVNGVYSLQDESDFHTVTNGNAPYLDAIVKEEPLSEEELELTQDLQAECILCTKQFNCIRGLKAHVIAHHSYKTVKRKPNNELSPEKHKNEHVCVTCRRRFSTLTDLMVHETCHDKVTCYGCNEKFEDFQTLLEHRRRCEHSQNVIPKPTKLEDVLRKRIMIPVNGNDSNTEATISCSDCNMVFKDIYYYNVHQELHKTSGDEDSSDSPDVTTTPIVIEALESICMSE